MMNDFQEAFKTVELVWDFERRTVSEGVTRDDIRRALLSVNAIDMDSDSLSAVERDMAELLHETVRKACRIYEDREKTSGISMESDPFRTFPGEEFQADSSGEIRSAIHKDGLGNVVRQTLEKVNSPESGESDSSIEKMEEEFRAESTEISDMTIAEIISSQTAPDESEECERVLDKEHDYIVHEDDMETADPEEEMGEALGKEGLERYNQEVWDKLEEKKERQRKRAEEKKRTDRWFRRLRAKQEAERELKLKREAKAKAIEEQNRIRKRHAEESVRGIALFQRRQRVYDSKKECEAYERETTRKHMAEQDDDRIASCRGYANLFKDMCNSVGIDCRLDFGSISDDTQGHVWDYVKVDGFWYYCDSVWNDGGSDEYPYMFSADLWEGRIQKYPIWGLAEADVG